VKANWIAYIRRGRKVGYMNANTTAKNVKGMTKEQLKEYAIELKEKIDAAEDFSEEQGKWIQERQRIEKLIYG